MRKRWMGVGVLAAAVSAVVVTAGSATAAPKLTNISIQLQWVPQAQFAGYYAALDLGYYKAAGLNVKLLNGGPQIVPGQVVASGRAQFGVNWLTALLAARDQGTDLVDIAQVFSRSGMTELTWKSSGITSIAGMRNHTVGVWCCGNQFELYAALTKHGMDPEKQQGVKIFNQPFTMTDFLSHRIDAAAAMTYNELAQVLESKNPKTGKLYTMKDLNVFPLQKEGTSMLEDGLFSQEKWVSGHRDVTMRFIAASDRGWIYCRDHVQQCTNIVLQNGTALPGGHQLWEMNEINKLVWPNTLGIGIMDPAAFKRTAAIALKYKVIKKAQNASAYDAALPKAALQYLQNHVKGIDIHGTAYRPITVTLKAGGK